MARSFAGGEIAPELYGRMDLDKYQTGLATCRNFVALPYGPAQNRPGFAYVNMAGDSSKRVRLIPFSFSADQTMVLEFGEQYIRFHTNGGTLLEATVAISSIASSTVNTTGAHGYSAGDWVFIGTRFFKVATIVDADTFTVTDLFGVAATPVGTTSARVYEIASPYLEDDLFDVHYVQSSDVLTLVHPGYAVRELRRLGATNWALTEVTFLPLLDAPIGVNARVGTGSGSTLYRYAVTALSENGLEESLLSAEALGTEVDSVNAVTQFSAISITSISKASTGVVTTGAAHGLVAGELFYLSGVAASMSELADGWYTVDTLTAVTATTFGLADEGGTAINTTGFTTYTSGGTTQEPVRLTTTAAHGLVKDDPVYIDQIVGTVGDSLNATFFVVGSVPTTTTITLKSSDLEFAPTSGSYTSGGRITLAGIKNDLNTGTNNNVIRWQSVTDAARYNVYKFRNGIFGYIGQTSGTSFTDNNIIPDTQKTPPELSQPFEASGDYPSAVSYFDQRRCFAATDNLPQTLWMTKTGTESNLSSSVPLQDDDAIIFKIAAREQNRIRHLIPLSDLIMLTAGGEWRVFTGSGDPVTPATVVARPQSYVGANNVQPVTTSITAIYISAQGSLFRELIYSADGLGSYRSEDLSVLTPHLVANYTFADMAFTRAPIPLLWATRNDGTLLGLTYLPEQRVRAWHTHDTTNGVFESVCCVAEGNEDVTYVVVKRTIDGQDVRYIERMSMAPFATAEDAFFVDSGATYSGAATTTITGLWHLEGEEVAVLGDGAVFPNKTVSGGSITLEQEVSKAQIGLPITSDIKTLPLTLESVPAMGSGYPKNVLKAYLRVYRSSGIFVGPSFDKLVEYKQRTTEVYGAPPELKTEEIDVPLTTTWQRDGAVCIRQSAPLPLTVQTLTLEVAIGG
jgi:hypothetical protein